MADLPHLIQSIHRVAHRAWASSSAEIGLSHSEFEYLTAVRAQARKKLYEDVHGQHLHDIVAELNVSKASASAMVSKLEARGLITRIPCQMDARAQHIILTDVGEALLAQGEALYQKIAEELGHIDRAALEQLNA